MGDRIDAGDLPIIVVSAEGSGQGKTAWVEALTRELQARGRRVGVVKHHPHGVEAGGASGKDTARARAAGAAAAVLAEPGCLHLYQDGSDAATLLERGVAALRATAKVDVVLAEGFRAVTCRARVWVGGGTPPVGAPLCVRVEREDSRDVRCVSEVLSSLLAAWR